MSYCFYFLLYSFSNGLIVTILKVDIARSYVWERFRHVQSHITELSFHRPLGMQPVIRTQLSSVIVFIYSYKG